MALIHYTFVRNEAHCIRNMLECVLPYVDSSYILIDDRSNDGTEDILDEYGVKTDKIKFENFSKTQNTILRNLYDQYGTHCLFTLAPDETISASFGENLKTLHNKHYYTNLDGVWFSRRHWYDLEMKKEANDKEKASWYPDWQLRLYRNDYPRIHFVNYVHEVAVGLRETIRVQEDIHHFNCYWKPKIGYDWSAMLQSYEDLKVLQKKEKGNNIWPDERT